MSYHQKSDTLVTTFSRMNPPTCGHLKIFKTASTYECDIKLHLSQTHNEKNPLSLDSKIHYLSLLVPEYIPFIDINPNIKSLFDIPKIYNGIYKNLIILCGSDRIEEYQTQLNRYNGTLYHFDSITVISVGDRDNFISASNARKAVLENDINTFNSIVIGNNLDIKLDMYNEIQYGQTRKDKKGWI